MFARERRKLMDRQGSQVGFGGWWGGVDNCECSAFMSYLLRSHRIGSERGAKHRGDRAADGSSGSANELRNRQPSAFNPQPPRGWSVPSFHERLISVIPNNLTHFC